MAPPLWYCPNKKLQSWFTDCPPRQLVLLPHDASQNTVLDPQSTKEKISNIKRRMNQVACSSEVHWGQRRALTEMVESQKGHTWVVGPVGGSACRRRRLIPRTSRKIARATMRKFSTV